MLGCTLKALILLCAVLNFDYANSSTKADKGPGHSSARVVVVDVDFVKQNSKLANKVAADWNDLLKKYQKIINGVEEKLKEEKDKISNIQNAEDYTKQVSQFEEKYNKFKHFVQNVRASLSDSLKKADDDWNKIVSDVIKKIAVKNGYDIVVTKDNTAFVEKRFDITEEVTNTINRGEFNIELKELSDVGSQVF